MDVGIPDLPLHSDSSVASLGGLQNEPVRVSDNLIVYI